MKEEKSLVKIEIPVERIAQLIFVIRGKKVMFDKDLADIYHVPTMRLNEQVKRNIDRFPVDFMFQLTKEEYESLRWQFATSNKDPSKQLTKDADRNLISQSAISSWGGTRKLPLVFTEHGVAMLSSVLKSKRAVEMNIAIIRAFIQLREMLATNKDLAQRMDELERSQKEQGNRLESVYSIVKQLIETPVKAVGKIGFNVKEQEKTQE
jgi:phage regulator Rha-like protein